MVVEIKRQICDGHVFKTLIGAGLSWLNYHQDHVNQLNVFPVPDGDTGTNMRLTMQKAYEIIADIDEDHVGIVGKQVASGALQGARGNSGVILSQLLSGFAEALQGHDVFDADLLVKACNNAVDAAYNAVLSPTEGTILTVARRMAEELEDYARTHKDLLDILDHMLTVARSALQDTPNMLPILKKAGVVDSGGQGLVFILEGMSRILHGDPVELETAQTDTTNPRWEDALEPDDEEGYGYDVQFLMKGRNLNVEQIRADIDAMGWSTLVVGSPELVKVHVHVHDPGQPITYAVQACDAIDDVVVENMQLQYENNLRQRLKRYEDRQVEGVAAITVATGPGIQELLYETLGTARVITGGQTMNPDVDDFLNAIASVDNEEIVLLPNNRNVVMAAQQAAKLVKAKSVRVVPTKTIPQGISVLLASLDARTMDDIDTVVEMMEEALPFVTTVEITTANRNAHVEEIDIREGQFIGLVNDTLVTAGNTIQEAALDVLQKAKAGDHELVTLYYGEGQTQLDAEALVEFLSQTFQHQEFEIIYGGQPLYPYIIGIE